jgi:hypothetical protein
VVDFVLAEVEKEGEGFDAIAPSPRATRAVGGGVCVAVASPLAETASSWESIVALSVAQPRRLARPQPRIVGGADLSLQALPADAPVRRRRRRHRVVGAMLLAVGLTAATLMVLVSGWMLTQM